VAASATFLLMLSSQALKAAASPGALASSIDDTSRRLASERWTQSTGSASAKRWRSAF
jgi:hypothetical protein